MEKYAVKHREHSETIIEIKLCYEKLIGVWLSRHNEKRVLLGILEKKTRKGFYYTDIFFKKQFVSWTSLTKIN